VSIRRNLEVSKLVNNGFLKMGRGGTINADLVEDAYPQGPKYFMKTVYGETYELSRSEYREVREYLDNK